MIIHCCSMFFLSIDWEYVVMQRSTYVAFHEVQRGRTIGQSGSIQPPAAAAGSATSVMLFKCNSQSHFNASKSKRGTQHVMK